MARPQQFDYEQVLSNAMQLFWRQGYVSTSVKDLTEATLLQPGSLYGTFKNKRNLFLESLEFYFSHLYGDIQNILHAEEAPLKRIENFFNYLIARVEEDSDHKSCLLVNTLLEIPADDDDINTRIAKMFTKIEAEFAEVLVEAQWDKSLPETADPKALAKMLMSGIFGLQIYNKIQPGIGQLRPIVDNLLNNLK